MKAKSWDTLFWILLGLAVVFVAIKAVFGIAVCLIAMFFVKSAGENAEWKEMRYQLYEDFIGGVGALDAISEISGLNTEDDLVMDVTAKIVGKGNNSRICVAYQNNNEKVYFLSDLRLSAVNGHRIYYSPGVVAFFFFGKTNTTRLVYIKS